MEDRARLKLTNVIYPVRRPLHLRSGKNSVIPLPSYPQSPSSLPPTIKEGKELYEKVTHPVQGMRTYVPDSPRDRQKAEHPDCPFLGRFPESPNFRKIGDKDSCPEASRRICGIYGKCKSLMRPRPEKCRIRDADANAQNQEGCPKT